MSSLTLSGISKRLGDLPVLSDVSLDLERGSRLAVVGASGSGKSTLLRLIGGFDRPDAGTIRAGEVEFSGPRAFVPAHRRGVGYVAQDGALFPHLTVRQNMGFGLRRAPSRERRVRDVAELVGLDDALLERHPHELSGGQQQRVALARALAPAPRIILLDEPFSALDTGLRAATREAVVAALERSDVTTVLVTHDQDEALSFGHRIAVIMNGTITQAGPPADVFRRPASAEVATFLGDAILLPGTVAGGIAHCHLGRVPVVRLTDGASAEGAAQLLLRPAQITLTAAPSLTPPPDAVITGRHFAGSTLRLRLRLTDADATRMELDLPTATPELYPEGLPVNLAVTGDVVAFPSSR